MGRWVYRGHVQCAGEEDMTLQVKLLGALFLVLLILGSYYATYRYGRHVEFLTQENIRKDAVLKQQEENGVIVLAYTKKLTEGMVQREQDQITINDARTKLRAVKLQVRACGSTMPGTSATTSDSDGTGELAAARINEYLDEARRAIDDIGERCARLNADAIRANRLNLSGE